MRPNRSAIHTACLLAALMFCTAHANAADACSLLTPEQASAVLRITVTAAPSPVPALCQWKASGQSKKVILTLLDEQQYAATKEMLPNSTRITKTPVSGIGDEAHYGTTARVATTLSVKKGSTAFTIRVAGFNEVKDIDEIKAKEKTLAEQILKKI